jgi:hypothetical protein
MTPCDAFGLVTLLLLAWALLPALRERNDS